MECHRCHFSNPDGFRFCGHCGCQLRVKEPLDSLHAERRHMTVMFCDLVGCTPLSERMDGEIYRELIHQYLEEANAEALRFHGYVSEIRGDGLLIYFCYPQAREDAPALSIRAGLAILRAMEELNRRLGQEGPSALKVRIGIHSGMVVIGELAAGQKDAVVGLVPNLAARIQGLAEPGGIVISGETHRLLGGRFQCRSLGEATLKGIAAPVPVFQVLEEIERATHTGTEGAATPLIGRSEELAQLDAAWARACTGGAEFLLIRGEAGIGKSRLLAEFHARILDEHCHWLPLFGTEPSLHSALQPLLNLLRHELAFNRNDSDAEKQQKIQNWGERLSLPAAETRPLLAAALGVPLAGGENPFTPAATRHRLIARLPELLTAYAALGPTVLAIEDLHWLDASTLEALKLLLDRGLPARVLIVGTARPEFREPWSAQPSLELNRLPDNAVFDFVESLAGEQELAPEIVRQVLRKSDGVPLFVEEMTRMALSANTVMPAAPAAEPLAIPDTLHALLMARLDRTTTNREVAQLAAVLGGEFHYEMLRSLCPLEDSQLTTELGRLVEAGLLARQGIIPNATFAFRHALIQAEAYQSLLRRKRQRYHEQIAQMLEERFPETRQTQPELVAHHYTEGGRAAEAIEYWRRAAERAAERMASHEALAHAERGLEILGTLSTESSHAQLEIALTLVRGWALTLHRGFAAAEVAAAYRHAHALLDRLNDASHAMQAAPSLFGFYIANADFPAARQIAEEIIRAGEKENDPLLSGRGWFSLGTYRYYVGELDGADANFAAALEQLGSAAPTRSERTLDPRVGTYGWGALTFLMRGYPDTALDWVRRACERAESLRHPHNIAFARQFGQLVHHWRGEPELVLVGMDEYLAQCREQGFGFWLAAAFLLQSWARGALGPSPEALAGLQRGIGLWQRTTARIAAAQHYATFADIAIRLDRLDEAEAALAKGREDARQTGERVYEPHLDILEGELWRERDPERSERSYRSSLALARECGARWHELRAATALARLLQKRGRASDAHTELAPVVDWFTEGRELAPLRAARELVAALR